MKKILFLLMTAVSMIAAVPEKAEAQAASFPLAPTALRSTAYGSVLDTLTSTAAHYFVTPKVNVVYQTLNIALKALELSGTTDGIATLEASGDSAVWYPYYGSIAKDSTNGHYQFDLADQAAAQGFRWQIKEPGDLWYRVKIVGVGSPSVAISAKYWGRKP